MALVLLGAAALSPGWANNNTRTVYLFLGVFPLINAVFDFASLGLTRYCLRQSLSGAPLSCLGHDIKSLKWWLIDLTGAIAALFALCAALLGAVVLINAIAAEPVMDLTQLFADLKRGSGIHPLANPRPFRPVLDFDPHALSR